MIIFINGPFCVGKTTTANLVVSKLKNGFVFDPEIIGSALSRIFGFIRRVDDFQDYLLWAPLTVVTAVFLERCCARSIVMPMTVCNLNRWRFISTMLVLLGHKVICVKLVCCENALRARISKRKNDSEPFEWCSQHLESGIRMMCHSEFGVAISTDDKSPREVAEDILQLAARAT